LEILELGVEHVVELVNLGIVGRARAGRPGGIPYDAKGVAAVS
jgi:hypothetical protein